MANKLRIVFAQVSPPGPYNIFTPPLGVLYLAAYLRERFPLEIKVINQRLEGLTTDQLAKRIVDLKPDIAALGCLTSYAYALPGLTQGIRQGCPKTLIAMGGAHVSAAREDALRPTVADVAIAGEGEVAFEKVVQAYISGASMDAIPGLIHRNSDGDIVTNPGVIPLIEDIDTLPFPAYDLIDLPEYWKRPRLGQMPKHRYIAMFSSRGCPYECIFCNKTFGREYRMHSAQRVIEEIRYYKKQYDINEIEYVDDCFNLNVKRVMEYTDLLVKELGPIRMAFCNGVRTDLLTEEVVDALAGAGMYFAVMPLESGSPRMQKFMGKHLDISKFLAAVEACSKRHVFTDGCTMFGFPTETMEEMESTIRTARDSQLHACSFFIPTLFPNSPLHKYVLANMPEKIPANYYNEIDARISGVNFSEVPDDEFLRFFSSLSRRFFMKPSRIARIVRDYPDLIHLPVNGAAFVLKRALQKVRYIS